MNQRRKSGPGALPSKEKVFTQCTVLVAPGVQKKKKYCSNEGSI
jgi:hypothetical protein